MGQVFERTFGAIKRNWLAFSLLALLFSALPQFALQWEVLQVGRGTTSWSLAGLASLASLIGVFLLQGALTYGAVADLNGRRPGFGECLSNGLRSFLPLLGLAIIMGLALMGGFILLIVPGVLMALAWSVATPVLVVERKGIFGSMGRSADLTRNYRGAIFLIAIVFWVLSIVIGAVVGAILGAAFGIGSVMTGTLDAGLIGFQAVIQGLVSGVEAMVGAAGIAAIYSLLRSIKEGIGPEALASVFD
jgi:MFS family permease